MTVTAEEAELKIALLLSRMELGETIVIERNGQPVGELRPVAAAPKTEGKRVLGGLEGKLKIPDDFDTMMRDEIEEMFYGKA